MVHFSLVSFSSLNLFYFENFFHFDIIYVDQDLIFLILLPNLTLMKVIPIIISFHFIFFDDILFFYYFVKPQNVIGHLEVFPVELGASLFYNASEFFWLLSL